MAMLLFLQQNPIVVDLATQPEPTRDISLDVVVGMFATAGVFLLMAAIGSSLVAGAIFFYKRWRDASAPATQSPHTHTSLGILGARPTGTRRRGLSSGTPGNP